MRVSFRVDGKPQAKQRPRFTRSGHVYTPSETTNYEKLIKSIVPRTMRSNNA